MRRRLMTMVLGPALIAGCAPALEGHIADQLAQAGVSRPMAECMAGMWAERLNVQQLRRMAETAEDMAQVQDSAGLGALLQRSRALQDPEIVEVVTLSAARCALNL